ncbi:MAG: DUF885 domain-containing protein, partial [Gammaproteobacteria bacterium]|nr:DUF885 domain-containing protein [Gammaproteobacteria bacterium]
MLAFVNFIPRLSFLILVAIALLGCSEPSEQTVAQTPEATSQSEDERLNAFFEEVFEREVALSPLFEALLGRKTERYGEWNDASDAAAEAENERRRQDLARLRSEFDYEALGPEAKVSYDIFVYSQEQEMRNFEFRNNLYVAHHTDSYALYLPVVLQNLHSVDNEKDAEAYISRLENSEAVLLQLTERLNNQIDSWIIAPEFVYPKILTDLNNLISGSPFDEDDENAVYRDFKKKVTALELSEEATADLLARARAAMNGAWRRGYETFRAAVERARDAADGNDGVWEHPNGENYYKNRIAHYTTLDMSADEIHELGLQEVARIQAEMETIKEQVGFDGSLLEFFEFIRQDPNNYYPNTDAGREQFLERQRGLVKGIYEKVDTYFNLLPKAELDVRRVEPFRENTAGIAFYNRPSADGSRPGIYYTNLRDMTAVQKYVHTAIAYHESAPGHHFQLALQQEMQDLPSFRKFGSYGSFVEGWALYSELLAKEMGFYQDPLEDVGRLQNEIWRAVRLVVDTGLHAKRWTREQGIEYFLQNTPLSVGDATTEIERYIARPGQALSYKIGMLKIQELRARAEKALGDAFDIRAYHDVVLQNGAVP